MKRAAAITFYQKSIALLIPHGPLGIVGSRSIIGLDVLLELAYEHLIEG